MYSLESARQGHIDLVDVLKANALLDAVAAAEEKAAQAARGKT